MDADHWLLWRKIDELQIIIDDLKEKQDILEKQIEKVQQQSVDASKVQFIR